MEVKSDGSRTRHVAVRLEPSCVGVVLFGCAATLVVVSFSNYLLETHAAAGFHLPPRMFAVNREANLPTWFQVMNIALAAVLTFSVAQAASGQWRRHWYGLAGMMLFFSLDELTSIHEQLVRPVRALLGTSGFFYFAWIIPGMLFVALVVILYLRFLANQPKRLRLGMVAAGAIFVGGAIGVEGLSAMLADNRGIENIEAVLPRRTFWFLVMAHIEEFLEMAGMALFNYSLLRYAPLREE